MEKYTLLISYLAAIPNISKRTSPANVTRFMHLTLLICYVVIVYLLSDQPGVHCCSLVEFHPDSSRLLLFAADDEYNIRVWKLDSSSCTAVLRGHYSAVTVMAFAPDGCLMYRCVCTLTRYTCALIALSQSASRS